MIDFRLQTGDWRTIPLAAALMLAISVAVGIGFGAIVPHIPVVAAHSFWDWLSFVKHPLETAVFEELFFRGLIFGGLRRVMPLEAAAIVSTLIFALLHWPAGLAMVVFAAVLGYILAKAYAKTGRISVPIAIHVLVIFAGMFLLKA